MGLRLDVYFCVVGEVLEIREVVAVEAVEFQEHAKFDQQVCFLVVGLQNGGAEHFS